MARMTTQDLHTSRQVRQYYTVLYPESTLRGYDEFHRGAVM